jgi:hypothetical protein
MSLRLACSRARILASRASYLAALRRLDAAIRGSPRFMPPNGAPLDP